MLRDDEKFTGEELRLLRAIREECRRNPNGGARSLFRLGVILSGLDYHRASECLDHLEAEGAIEVDRRGPGSALVIREVIR